MTITEAQFLELRIAFNTWRAIEQVSGRPYPTADAFDAVVQTAVQHGALEGVKSSWARACFEAVKAGKISLHQPTPQPPPIPENFEDEVRAMTPTELRTKLNRDPAFASLFGRVACGEKPEGYVTDEEYELTAQQWRSLPPDVAARKMQDSKFRAAVDRLIQNGEI